METTDLVLIPENAPLDPGQRAWMNGYLAGLLAGKVIGAAAAPALPARGPLLFLYGSQTGSAEGLARKFARQAVAAGFESKHAPLDDFASADLASHPRIAVITSTYGDGEMPDNAQGFWDFLRNGAPRLERTEFAVLALGDTSYVQFCEAGKLMDARMAELGARRIMDRLDCDTDYESVATTWFDGLLQKLGGASVAAPAVEEGYTKTNPFRARLKANRKLNSPGSDKDTRHIELAFDPGTLEYEVGDALGVIPCNCPQFVQEILTAAGLDGEEAVTMPSGDSVSLRKALTESWDLSAFLTTLPVSGIGADELVASLKKLQPRLYSISSSPKAHPGEVHLTVGVVRYAAGEFPRVGVCSTFLADRVAAEGVVPVYIHRSPGFRPPADPAAPMIMVGPGTGIAPFRAFLAERRATGATGRNWLLFGDRSAEADFLYRDEMETMQRDGFLTRMDTAFSRDQAEKLYVQHRMLEHADELWQWLEEGAHFYVCGDAKRMAKDVESALLTVIAGRSGGTPESAVAYLTTLKKEKRYQRDVY